MNSDQIIELLAIDQPTLDAIAQALGLVEQGKTVKGLPEQGVEKIEIVTRKMAELRTEDIGEAIAVLAAEAKEKSRLQGLRSVQEARQQQMQGVALGAAANEFTQFMAIKNQAFAAFVTKGANPEFFTPGQLRALQASEGLKDAALASFLGDMEEIALDLAEGKQPFDLVAAGLPEAPTPLMLPSA